MEEININDVVNEAGKMRKFFKAFSQIDQILVAMQNSDVVLKQLNQERFERENDLGVLKADIALAEVKLTDSRQAVAEAIKEVETRKRDLETEIANVQKQAEENIINARALAEKEIMEIRAGVNKEQQAGLELSKTLKAKQDEALKNHDAIMAGIKAEEVRLEEKIHKSRAILEDNIKKSHAIFEEFKGMLIE